MEQRLERLEQKIDQILVIVTALQKSGQNMDSHIQAVETVFEQIQKPANFVKRQIEKLMGSSTTATPEIEFKRGAAT